MVNIMRLYIALSSGLMKCNNSSRKYNKNQQKTKRISVFVDKLAIFIISYKVASPGNALWWLCDEKFIVLSFAGPQKYITFAVNKEL